MNANRLLPFLGNFFGLIHPLLQGESTGSSASQDLQSLRSQIKAAMADFELLSREAGVEFEVVHHAKYALIAFVDELVIRIAGVQSHEWVVNPLQIECFGENTAGERFFAHLADLRLQGERYIDAIELYYLCLELGFYGQFRKNDLSILLQLKNSVFLQIQQIRKYIPQNLLINSGSFSHEPIYNSKGTTAKALLLATGSLLLLAIGFWCAMSYQAKANRTVILNYAQAITEPTWSRVRA